MEQSQPRFDDHQVSSELNDSHGLQDSEDAEGDSSDSDGEYPEELKKVKHEVKSILQEYMKDEVGMEMEEMNLTRNFEFDQESRYN